MLDLAAAAVQPGVTTDELGRVVCERAFRGEGGGEVLDLAAAAVRPGVTTDELDRVVRERASRGGGRGRGWGGREMLDLVAVAGCDVGGSVKRGMSFLAYCTQPCCDRPSGIRCEKCENNPPTDIDSNAPPPLPTQVHEGMMERGAYPSPYNYYNFPKVGEGTWEGISGGEGGGSMVPTPRPTAATNFPRLVARF